MEGLLKDLHRSVPIGDRSRLEQIWQDFSARYPYWGIYGEAWLRSRIDGASPLGDRLPWTNYPSLEWLEGYIRPWMRVYEWGSGGSTLFFAERVRRVVSVEHDPEWYERVRRRIAACRAGNVLYELVEPSQASTDGEAYKSGVSTLSGLSFERYVRRIDDFEDGYFHLILIDGRARLDCLKQAPKKVRPGGAIMLDNSDYDRYQERLKHLGSSTLGGFRQTQWCAPGPFSKTIGWCTTIWSRPTNTVTHILDQIRSKLKELRSE